MAIFTGIVVVDIIGVFVAISVVIYGYFHWIFQYWKRRNIPYLQPIFPYGNKQPLYKAVALGDDIYNVVEKAKKKGWNYFGMFLVAKPIFVPLELDVIKHIMTKDFNHFTDRGIYCNERDDPLSAHLFALGGVKWKNLRAKLTPTFTSGKMRSMFQTIVNCGLQLEEILKQHDCNEPLDIKYILACFSTDVIGSCAFGIECNSFKEPDSPFIRNGKKIFSRGLLQQAINLLAFSFPNISRALHVKLTPSDVSKFFYGVVTNTVNYREKNNFSRNDFLQLLIDLKKDEIQSASNIDDGSSLTMDEMVAQCFLFFLAGFETSSTTMTFALYELSIHPEIQEKVREELLQVLKKFDNKICYDSLKELEYMQQVIDETLRKYPPLPFLTRQCNEDYKIPNSNIILEKGTDVIIPIKNIHYNEKNYEKPEEFDPERFSAENKQRRHQYAHIPFGEGPRICIGMRFGLMQSKVGLASVLRNFRVSLSSKTKIPLEMDASSFVPSTKGGMWLNLEKL